MIDLRRRGSLLTALPIQPLLEIPNLRPRLFQLVFQRRFARDDSVMLRLPVMGFPPQLNLLLLGQQDFLLREWRAPSPLAVGPLR